MILYYSITNIRFLKINGNFVMLKITEKITTIYCF